MFRLTSEDGVPLLALRPSTLHHHSMSIFANQNKKYSNTAIHFLLKTLVPLVYSLQNSFDTHPAMSSSRCDCRPGVQKKKALDTTRQRLTPTHTVHSSQQKRTWDSLSRGPVECASSTHAPRSLNGEQSSKGSGRTPPFGECLLRLLASVISSGASEMGQSESCHGQVVGPITRPPTCRRQEELDADWLKMRSLYRYM